jgi:hypothetical protein
MPTDTKGWTREKVDEHRKIYEAGILKGLRMKGGYIDVDAAMKYAAQEYPYPRTLNVVSAIDGAGVTLSYKHEDGVLWYRAPMFGWERASEWPLAGWQKLTASEHRAIATVMERPYLD